MKFDQGIFGLYSQLYDNRRQVELSLEEYLGKCSDDPTYYAGAAERMLRAIGEPVMVDTSQDPRLGRIFMNRTIKVYPEFADFFGMEETIERIVGFFRHAAQGLEERKQILYLLGPVGGGKSSLAERLKQLMEKEPVYVLKAGNEVSPVFESPLGLFDPVTLGPELEKHYAIPVRRLTGTISPWAVKRLEEFGGDITKFTVVRMQPSRLKQICISKTEPGDENNQDVSSLVGKVDIRKLEFFSQNDPDAYSFSGGLNRTTQGLMEFVEMFKAPIKMLHPLLTSTQEGNYVGSENIGGIPYQGIVLAHSNEAEWQSFKNNKNNEAFIDRISVIKVPYCLRSTEERKIYEKLLQNSELSNAACAPSTLDILARFSVLSRVKSHENSNLYSKMRVYDGESLKDTDPRAKSVQEYRDAAGVDEGMDGISTRFAFKVLSSTFNFDTQEVAADPVHLMYVLEQAIWREQFPEDAEKKYLNFIKAELAPRYAEFIGNEIQKAYLESYSDYGQNLFDRYVAYADAWIEDSDYKDPDTGQLMNRELLNQELSKIEKPAGIANPKDFRNEVVKFALRARANNSGRNPSWTSYEKLREVIERRMFSQVEDLLPVISFGTKKDTETEKKHAEFLERMVSRGYTERQVRRLVEWYMRVNKAGYGIVAPAGGQPMNIVDRRPNPKGKSLSNRQRFLSRARAEVKSAVQEALRKRKVADVGQGEKVAIPTRGIAEPIFHHSRRTGRTEHVVPGNKEYVKGDEIPRPTGGEGRGGSQGSPDGSGEDAFEFTLSKEEFLDMFFEDLELPDLVKKSLKETFAVDLQRAGYQVTGSPANLSIRRTMRNSMARRISLRRPKAWELEALREAIEKARARGAEEEAERLQRELDRLEHRSKIIPYIDPLDVRYNRYERVPRPNTEAVMFCLMDVSGSMTEAMKDLAKRFFMLLHVFLIRRYRHVDIVFIRHTSTAEEVDEETFFYSRETGGTVVSTALEKMLEIARARYPTDRWNIYAAQASDGDNYGADSGRCVALLGGEVLPLCQYFAYVEVGDGMGGSLTGLSRDSDLWRAYNEVAPVHPHFVMRRVNDPSQIFSVFHELFSKGGIRA